MDQTLVIVSERGASEASAQRRVSYGVERYSATASLKTLAKPSAQPFAKLSTQLSTPPRPLSPCSSLFVNAFNDVDDNNLIGDSLNI